MPATCHRVVGIIDVEENPEFLLQLEAPIRAAAFTNSRRTPNSLKFFTTARLKAEVQQLAADLKIEYERYQRQSLVGAET